ncbi:MAG TPA: acyltransferase family protein [Longimicrobiales bacterium]
MNPGISMNPRPAAPVRRHDLDWLRVIAILLLLYYHTGMIFAAEWGWHIKNAETSALVLELNYFLSRWRMALLFLISGIGTSFALRRRTAGEYVGERMRRLLVPVVFGMFVIVPPQIYFERIANGAAYGSYLDFYPEVFGFAPYPEGAFSWHHLWFVFYLFCYSLAALPLFLYLRSDAGRRWAARVAQAVRGPGLYALAIPPGAVLAALIVRFPGPQNIVDDWASMLYYFLFFVYGYVLAVAEGVWAEIEARRRTSLTLAFLAIVAIDAIRWNGATPEFTYSVSNTLYHLLQAFNAWCWVLALLGYGRRYLNRPSRVLDYANEGIYPFYILHQTVIVVIGYYVVQVEEGILAKYLFVSTVSLAVSWAVYHLLVRPFPAARFLFGMKPQRPGSGTAAPSGRGPAPAPTPAVAGSGRAPASA